MYTRKKIEHLGKRVYILYCCGMCYRHAAKFRTFIRLLNDLYIVYVFIYLCVSLLVCLFVCLLLISQDWGQIQIIPDANIEQLVGRAVFIKIKTRLYKLMPVSGRLFHVCVNFRRRKRKI